MAGKKEIQKAINEPFENRPGLEKLVLYVSIAGRGQGESIRQLFENDIGCSFQFIESGSGTATKSFRDILGIEDNRKDVVFSLIRQSDVDLATHELNNFFIEKKHLGIGFCVNLSTIIGVKAYKFLANAD